MNNMLKTQSVLIYWKENGGRNKICLKVWDL